MRGVGHAAGLLVVVLLGLAGCGTAVDRADAIDPRCRVTVDEDPKVRALLAASAGSLENFALLHKRDLADARADANLRCLRARGILSEGGVERYNTPGPTPLF